MIIDHINQKIETWGFPLKCQLPKKIFEILPGFLTWTLLLLPVIFALFKWDTAFVIYIAYLVAYWTFRTFKFLIGIFIGLRRSKRDLSTDWMEKIRETNLERFQELRYVYLCPVYSESLDILDPTFQSWANSDVGAEKIDVVMAMEGKKEELQVENFNKLKEKYGDKFGSMTTIVHPFGIPGE